MDLRTACLIFICSLTVCVVLILTGYVLNDMSLVFAAGCMEVGIFAAAAVVFTKWVEV